MNTPADSRLNGLIQAHFWRVDSDRWGQVARDLYRPVVPNVIMNASDQNVAICSAGIAFELAIKSLARITGATVTPTHRIEEAYRSLEPENQRRIRTAVRVHLNWSMSKFFDCMDKNINHPDRKYSMVDKKGAMRFSDDDIPLHKIDKVRVRIVELAKEEMTAIGGRHSGRSERPSRLTRSRP